MTRELTTLISFCLVPFVIVLGGIIHEGHKASMFLAGIVILASFIKNIWFRFFVWYWIIWVLGLSVMSIFGKMPIGVRQNAFWLSAYLVTALPFYIAIQDGRVKTGTILNFICGTAVVQSFLAIGQMWNFDPMHNFVGLYLNAMKNLPFSTTTGSLGNNNFLAVYLTICLPLFYRKYWAYYVPVLVAVILVSLTSTAVVAGMIGTFIFFHKKIKWRWLALASVPFIIYLLMTKASLTWKFTLDHDRFEWWRAAILFANSTWESMTFGFGPGISWGKKFPIHNEFVTAYFNFGAIGLGLALMYLITAYRKNTMLYSSLIIAAVTMNGTYPLHLAPHTMLIFIIMGLMEREKIKNANIERSHRALRGIDPIRIKGKVPGEAEAEVGELRQVQ